jgi:hypothetical protein
VLRESGEKQALDSRNQLEFPILIHSCLSFKSEKTFRCKPVSTGDEFHAQRFKVRLEARAAAFGLRCAGAAN